MAGLCIICMHACKSLVVQPDTEKGAESYNDIRGCPGVDCLTRKVYADRYEDKTCFYSTRRVDRQLVDSFMNLLSLHLPAARSDF